MARLRHGQAWIEDVDYRAQRRLDKAMFQQLATCRWIADNRNLLVVGKCGLGKSWLACALAHKACRDGYTVHYARVPRYLQTWNSRMAMGALRASSELWPESVCSSLTISDQTASTPVSGAI